ncbi:MAG: hypothetical protein AABY22_23495 [Nanoarchaeota archaeon]
MDNNIEILRKQIREDPYNFIMNWMDKNLLIVGKEAFKILALMPHSLFLPDIKFASTDIRANINNLIIAHSGDGKSTLSKKFSQLCYNPIVRRSITTADLIDTASELKWVSLVIEDLSQTADEGYDTIKVIEGIIGDEKSINRSTMNKEYTGEVKGIGFLGVTPHDLERFAHELESGLLSRCTLTLIKLTHNDRKKIEEFKHLRAGDSKYAEEIRIIDEIVIDFYMELQMIQRGRHNEYLIDKYGKNHNKEVIKPIISYEIDMKFKQEFFRKWTKILDNLMKQGQHISNRESQEYYRFLVSHAFLQVFNRDYKNGILIPNEEDHRIALDLTIQNLKYKWAIPIALESNKRTKTLDALEKLINQGLPEVVRDVLINISPNSKYIKDKVFN